MVLAPLEHHPPPFLNFDHSKSLSEIYRVLDRSRCLMRRCCTLCGQSANVNDMKRMYPTPKNPNLILVASLSLIGVVDKGNVDTVVEQISRNKIYLCHSHVIEAVQYLCAELAASGSRLSYFDDPCIGRINPYISTADIPPQLVETINGVSNGTIIITARDIWSFINGALKKYHVSCLWPERNGQEQEVLREAAPNAHVDESAASFIKVEVDSGEDPYLRAGKGPIKVEPGSEGEFSMTEERGDHGDEASVLKAKVPDHPASNNSRRDSKEVVHRVGQTDEADLQRYYLVQGDLLMSLFHFCPECGQRLERTQLKPIGTAAVVMFECGGCSLPVRRWESQERVVAHSRERKYKGNTVAAISAIITGLKFEDLVRWAQQLKLALFSKSFFYQVYEWTRTAIETVYRSQKGSETVISSERMEVEDMLAEMSAETTVEKTRDVQRKHPKKKPKLSVGSLPQHSWGDLIVDEVLRERLIALEAKSSAPQQVADFMDDDDDEM